ncbi:MAG: 16S rRNA (cytosine(1402)-N(4))-methyltransferase RsmH [Candidatus Moraniibacteriota bacterium]
MTRHIPVLLAETVDGLHLKKGDVVVDATLGGGGHTLALLEKVLPGGRVISFDMDAQAIDRFLGRIENDPVAKQAYQDGHLILVHANFSHLEEELDRLGIERVNGIMADLGFSSDQIETPDRGLSFLHDGPLDMRLNGEDALTAEEVIRRYSEERLAEIFSLYGDEPKAKRIARRITTERKRKEVRTTTELARIIEEAFSGAERRAIGIHPATRVFQALRIEVNREFERLNAFLLGATGKLAPGGRLAIISFHSGEDRIVKEFFRLEAKGCVCPPNFPECRCGRKPQVKIVTGKPIGPSEEEQVKNPRSRSAKLRIAQRI